MTEQIKPKHVRRFAFDAESMYETEHGKYVLYSDHAETVQQLQRENAELKESIIGVGDGSGKLFVYGKHDAVKRVQKFILDNEQLRAELAAAKQQLAEAKKFPVTPAMLVDLANKTGDAALEILNRRPGKLGILEIKVMVMRQTSEFIAAIAKGAEVKS